MAFRAGVPLDCEKSSVRFVLIPDQARLRNVRTVEDPVTGLALLTAGCDAPRLNEALKLKGKRVPEQVIDPRKQEAHDEQN